MGIYIYIFEFLVADYSSMVFEQKKRRRNHASSAVLSLLTYLESGFFLVFSIYFLTAFILNHLRSFTLGCVHCICAHVSIGTRINAFSGNT